MKEIIDAIIKQLVERPENVELTAVEGDKTCIYELRCHAGDVGKIIGKNGKTVAAIRSVLNAVAAHQGKRAVIEVVE